MKEDQAKKNTFESIEEFEETFLPATAREKKTPSGEWERFWKDAEKSLSMKRSVRGVQT
jgi:hypothetical protein